MNRYLERGRRPAVAFVLAVTAGLAACSDGSGGAAQESDELIAFSEQVAGMVAGVSAAVEQVIPMFLAPSAAAANGVTITPGSNPNSYDVVVPVDLDGNGSTEGTINGVVVLSGDPFTFGAGYSWTFEGVITSGQSTFTAGFTFEMAGGGVLRVSGSGMATSPNGIHMNLEIDPSAPIVVKTATGDPDSIGNLCTHSVSGDIRVTATFGPIEVYSALWSFVSNRRTVQVTDATRVDEASVETGLPDRSFQVPCDAGTLSDWVGTYDFNWFCNPQEDGDSEMVITVTGPNTIHIDDEGLEYDATALPGYPHVVRGFFIDAGYREDFLWQLSPDGKTFTQLSIYAFLPPGTGGGICGGIGTKR